MASRLVSGKHPLPGTDPAADAIYARRGARGITALDAALLNAPDIALGYSSLLDAIRTKGKLPGNIREAMILRIAALNHAAYEWIQHVEIGRRAGLSTGQLYVIRDIDTPLLLPSSRLLGPLLTAAIRFTDHSTRLPISLDVCRRFKEEIRKWLLDHNEETVADGLDANVDGFYVEAAMVVATYNMVSRFLVSSDVGGISDVSVPWPVERKERFVSVPSFPPSEEPTHQIHTITLTTSPSAPWLVFSNSLNTDWRMWNYVVPILLDLRSSLNGAVTYNILLHSQRGHGLSTLPPPTESQHRLTTIPLLAMDINHLLETLAIPTPVQSVIGVSQGGATALAFAALFGEKTRSVVVCDTAATTPPGNKQAWEERTALVCGSCSDGWHERQGNIDIEVYAEKVGMRKLAQMTLPRWFPEGSTCHPGSDLDSDGRVLWLEEMMTKTNVKGFFHGAKALGSYDVLSVESRLEDGNVKRLFDTRAEKVLLVAGALDGGGKVGKGLRGLREGWISSQALPCVEFVEIAESGHLPMIDSPEAFCEVIAPFLTSYKRDKRQQRMD